jgi:hypothetical protein
MTEEMRIAYVQAQTVAANIELQAMLAKNAGRASVGRPAAYGEGAIYALINRYGLHHNAVISYLCG